ncbi:HTH-type transcriptional repressor FabR [Rhodoferax sp. BLA1]|uniref:HTH-type transcriptional repressor FabR n=1 Tax=Rhodoferax sp. BLA1 TaxID=2576062 RepID=UPI0015D3801D|nr:HTH-type transcriptional repressor FabR [Rhodoferax sp. BLA1]
MAAPPSASKRADSLTRSERKDLTRASLLQAALALIGEGRSFTSLGIREIAREAGMVPNAFYRHFRNTDDLGLALVEEMGITLRRLLREARQVGVAPNAMVRRSVQVYYEYVQQNRLQFLFISSERSGGSRILRLAIRTEVSHFINEMAQDFRRLGIYPDMSTSSLQMVCGLIVTTMLAAAPEILDLPPEQALLEAEMKDNFVQQLQVVLLGAGCWKEKRVIQSTAATGL